MYTNKYLYETTISAISDNILKRKNTKYSEYLASKNDIKQINKLTTNENRKMVYSKLDSIRVALNSSNCKYSGKLIELIDNINTKNSQIIRKRYLKTINGPITKILKDDIKYLNDQIDDINQSKNKPLIKKIQLKLFKVEKHFTQKHLYLSSQKMHKSSISYLKNLSKIRTYKKYINLLQNQDNNIEYFSKFINSNLTSSNLFTVNEKKSIRQLGKEQKDSDLYSTTLKKQKEMKKILNSALKNEPNKIKRQKIEKTLKQISYDPYIECMKSCLSQVQYSNEGIRLSLKSCYLDKTISPRKRAQKMIPLLQQELFLAKLGKPIEIPGYTFEVSIIPGNPRSYKFDYYDGNEILVKSSLYSIPEMNAHMNIKSKKITSNEKCKILNKLINQLSAQNSGRNIMDELKIDLQKESNYDYYKKLNPYILYMLKEEHLVEYAKTYISQEIKPIGYKSPITVHEDTIKKSKRQSIPRTEAKMNSTAKVQSSFAR